MLEELTGDLLGGNIFLLALFAFIILCVFLAIRIVPQSEKHVIERFGRLRSVLGPGINFIVPFLDKVAHKISVLERQLPSAEQDAIVLTGSERTDMRTNSFFHPNISRQLAAGGVVECLVGADMTAFDQFGDDRVVAG